jgi:hypothetical protein
MAEEFDLSDGVPDTPAERKAAIIEAVQSHHPERNKLRYDPRFPNQQMTKRCWVNYLDSLRCTADHGHESDKCRKFTRAAVAVCPTEWVCLRSTQNERPYSIVLCRWSLSYPSFFLFSSSLWFSLTMPAVPLASSSGFLSVGTVILSCLQIENWDSLLEKDLLPGVRRADIFGGKHAAKH